MKVMLPEMLVGLLLEMVTGSEFTPKGGLTKLLAAHEVGEPMPERSGKYGEGCYKDECWSITAIRKRVTAVRKFYELHLEGIKEVVNPGWHSIVKGTMVSIMLLLGEEAQHVRDEARTRDGVRAHATVCGRAHAMARVVLCARACGRACATVCSRARGGVREGVCVCVRDGMSECRCARQRSRSTACGRRRRCAGGHALWHAWECALGCVCVCARSCVRVRMWVSATMCECACGSVREGVRSPVCQCRCA